MSKYLISNTNTIISMTRKQAIEAFTGISNQLDNRERTELLGIILPMLSRNDLNKLLNFCCERFPYQTSLSLEENGIVEPD